MTFDIAFDRLLGHEGKFSSDPKDRGNWTSGIPGVGELKGTKWGISAMSYPHLDIENLERYQAKEIYQKDFWNRIHADELPFSVAFQMFDFAVNSSIETAVRRLQRAINVADDGIWGPVSRAQAAQMSETDIIMRLLGMRLDFMTRLTGWEHNSRGWARRIAQNLLYGAEDA